MRWLVVALLCLPFIELYTLVTVAKAVGVFNAVLLVLAASVIGVSLIKQQGFNSLQRIQAKLERGAISSLDIAEGLLLGLAGLLFLIPGFVTDGIALLFLLPPTRRLIARLFFSAMPMQTFHGHAHQHTASRVIDGEVIREPADDKKLP